MPKLFTALSIAVGIVILSWGWWDVYQHRKKTAIPALRVQFPNGHSLTLVLHESITMKKISSKVVYFFLTIAALTAEGLSAAVDGAISVVSSDPNVLLVEPTEDGRFKVTRTGVGLVTLTVSGDADLGDGVRPLEKVIEFEVYDASDEPDHFDVAITDMVFSDTTNTAEGDGADTTTESTTS